MRNIPKCRVISAMLPTFALGFARCDAALPHGAFYGPPEGHRAMRVGDWKRVSESGHASQWELHNLKRDRIESKCLAVSQPDEGQQLSAV